MPPIAIPVPLEALTFVGAGLQRPECVLATARGDLYTADWRGGVAHLRTDGSQALYRGTLPGGRPLRPNGIALRRDGSFLLADLGDAQGGVFRLERDGAAAPLLERVDGVDLPPTNFVLEDAPGRIWITVSTRRRPRAAGLPRRRRRRLRRARRRARRAHRRRRPGLHQRGAAEPGRCLALRQRDLRPPPDALSHRRRRCARRPRDRDDVRRTGPIPTASPSTPKAACGSSASSPTA